MNVLGIDCATTAGWALVTGSPSCETLLDRGTVALANGCACVVQGLVERVRQRLKDRGEAMAGLVVAIEEPYLAHDNPKTLKVLARLVGRLEQAFELAGAEVVTVTAQSWQACVLGVGPRRFGGVRRADRKAAAGIVARSLFGRGLTEDEADAAMLAVHVLRQRAHEGRLAAATPTAWAG